jgi:hypothetical protein
MRKTLALASVSLALVLGVVASVAADDKPATPAQAAFAKLKSLAGEWTKGEGKGVTIRYSVVSGGSVVFEHMMPGTPYEMITMYHLDKDDLVLTHYCAHGNQPHMKAKLPFDGKKLVWEFAGGTNFDPAKDPHMHEATFTFTDDDHLRTDWTSFEKGAKSGTHSFELTRIKK